MSDIYDGQGSSFFRDQSIFKEDLHNIEYTKTKVLRDTIKHTTGIPGVCATSNSADTLKVAVAGNSVIVNPGTAIDDYGRLIDVPTDISASGSQSTDPYYHPAWPAKVITHTAGAGTFYVHVAYTTQEGISEVDDDGTTHYSRMYDSYAITISTSRTSPNGGVLLAQFTANDSGNIQAPTLRDLRTFYTSLFPSTFDVTDHQLTYHLSGLGDNPPPVGAAYGSLGIAISNYSVGPVEFGTISLSDISTFANVGGEYVTGELNPTSLTWEEAVDADGYYGIYIKSDKSIYRTDAALTEIAAIAAIPSDGFSVAIVQWSSDVLSLINDLRNWGVGSQVIDGVQVLSGSVTLNVNSAGTKFTDSDAWLNFINSSHYLKWDNASGRFVFSNILQVTQLVSNGVVYINYDGPEGDSHLYFYNGGSPTGAYLQWDDTNGRFVFSNNLQVPQLVSNGVVYINYDGPDGDSSLYFYNNSSPTDAYLLWQDAENKFKLSHGLSMNSTKIEYVLDPTADQDAATKKYVDDNIPTLDTLDSVCDRGNSTDQVIDAAGLRVTHDDGEQDLQFNVVASDGVNTAFTATAVWQHARVYRFLYSGARYLRVQTRSKRYGGSQPYRFKWEVTDSGGVMIVDNTADISNATWDENYHIFDLGAESMTVGQLYGLVLSYQQVVGSQAFNLQGVMANEYSNI